MSGLAAIACAAAEAEGSMASVAAAASGDTESQERAKLVRVTAGHIEKLTPRLIDAAKLLAQDSKFSGV